jgi:hypothetical protein
MNVTEHALMVGDLAAMRMAEDVSLHLGGDLSILRLYTRGAGDPAVFTAQQQRLFADGTFTDRRARDIAVTASAMGYGGGDASTGWHWNSARPDETPTPSCFYSTYYSPAWATIARSLRVGDRLHLEWVADNNNGYSREVGLHVDQVRLRATRAKGGKALDTWHLGWAICQDNSARMIRRATA